MLACGYNFCIFVKKSFNMKKILFLILIIFSFTNVKASHLMGGEITWECVKMPGPDLGKYIFTMKLYRDCDGIVLNQTPEIVELWDNGVNILNITCDFISNSDISPLCNSANSFPNQALDCLTNPVGAVEEYIYQSTPLQLVGTPPISGWHFTWDECCRNDALDNLLDPDIQGFTLRASMYPFTDPITGMVLPANPCFDSSPVFNESPKTIICSGYPFAYSHNASDPELDSIRYYWAEPLDDGFLAYDPDPANNSPAAIPFVGGFTFNSPIPGGPALNPISGEISYASIISGNYATVTRVESFKCGQKIAEIHRDIQAVLIPCSPLPGGGQNNPPLVPPPLGAQVWTVTQGSTVLDAYETTVTAGELVTFNIQGVDTNLYNGVTQQDLTMEVSGGQIIDPVTSTCANPPCATFVSNLGLPTPIISPGLVEGVFEWQTTCDHVSSDIACGRTTNLYQFSVKVYDDFCPAPAIRNVTLMVYVEADNQMQVSKIEPSCFGNDGEISISPSLSITQIAWDAEIFDLSGNLVAGSYNILGNIGSLSNLSAGNYILRASGAGGCIVEDSVILLLAPNPLNMHTNSTDVSCYGGSDGEISVYLDNGLLPYTFFINGVENINPPPYDSLFTDLTEGTYIITIADSDSCGLVETIYIDAPNFPLQILSSNSVTICDTSLEGFTYAYAAGGTPYSSGVYLFEWYDSNMGSIGVGDSIFNLGVGDYFLEVTDSNDCQANLPITVSTPQLPLEISSLVIEPVVCTGASTGWVVASAGLGTAPYSYVWSDMNGVVLKTTNNVLYGDTLSGLSADTYHLMVSDASGCIKERTIYIVEDPILLEISSVLVADSIDCYGDLDGRAVVTMSPSSGSPSYSYLWDNGETSLVANSLSGGLHTVTVTDSRGCVVVGSVDIPENSQISSTLLITNPISCYGDNDGSIQVSTLGGVQLLTTPGYDYFWSNGVSSNINYIDNLSQGSYFITTRDELGCVIVDSIYLPEPSPLYVNASQILRVSCNGLSDGSAYALGVGGTLPYEFTWLNNSIVDLSSNDSSNVDILFSGLETVSLEDSRGCIIEDTVLITQPEELVVIISDSSFAYCTGVNTASATAFAVGGSSPYTYEWDDNNLVPQSSITALNLDAGTYTVTVEDTRGCLADVSVDLTHVTSTMLAAINTLGPSSGSTSCYGSNDGALTVQVNGGSLPYTYQWFGPTGISFNDSIFNLSEGNYSVTVTDINGCIVNTDQEITSPAPLLYTISSSTNTSCLGSCDGEVELYIQGGVAPYEAQLLDIHSGISLPYSVNSSSLVTGVCTGIYTITIKDANNCDGVLLLGGSDEAILDTTITTDISAVVTQDINCYGSSTGAVSAINPQTSASYSYTWLDLNGNTVSTSSTASSLQAGDYILSSSWNNVAGCTTLDTITILQRSLIFSNAVVNNASCEGRNDGSIITAASGGVGVSYLYSWSPLSATSSSVSNLAAGTYTLTITDANNCSVLESYTVTEPGQLVATVTSSQTYILNASATGGTPPYSYVWEDQNQFGFQVGTGPSYTVGSYGTYYVVVTDANSCESISNSVTYNQGPLSIGDLNTEIYLSVYPNPFREETTVDFGQRINSAEIRIIDIYGKLIELYEITNSDKYVIKRTDKASGVYFIEVEIERQYLSTVKLIIE